MLVVAPPLQDRAPTDVSTGDKTQVEQSHDTTEHNVVLVPRPLDTARDPLVCLFRRHIRFALTYPELAQAKEGMEPVPGDAVRHCHGIR